MTTYNTAEHVKAIRTWIIDQLSTLSTSQIAERVGVSLRTVQYLQSSPEWRPNGYTLEKFEKAMRRK